MAKVIIDTAKAHEIARRYQSGSLTTHIINEIIRSGTPVEETKEKENENAGECGRPDWPSGEPGFRTSLDEII